MSFSQSWPPPTGASQACYLEEISSERDKEGFQLSERNQPISLWYRFVDEDNFHSRGWAIVLISTLNSWSTPQCAVSGPPISAPW